MAEASSGPSTSMSGSEFTLHGYFRSSAAFRVRIALNLKDIAADQRFVHLRKNEQFSPDYAKLNPQHLVPTLIHRDRVIRQSIAIMEYLDEVQPEPPLLPRDAAGRARVRALSLAVACDIHPLNNLRVLRHLKDISVGEECRADWQRHWITEGFAALEQDLAGTAGRFCVGDAPTMADCCLIPQMINARRAEMDLSSYPTLLRIEAACNQLAAFRNARPENQADAE
jgi:maleylacetoacetate isomerase